MDFLGGRARRQHGVSEIHGLRLLAHEQNAQIVNYLTPCRRFLSLSSLPSKLGPLLWENPQIRREPMWTKLFGLAAAAGVIALSSTTPALALCNPGTPHCIRADSPWLANAKKQVNQGKESSKNNLNILHDG
jgi:hypothetical protein